MVYVIICQRPFIFSHILTKNATHMYNAVLIHTDVSMLTMPKNSTELLHCQNAYK